MRAGTQLLYLTLCVFALALVGVFYPYNRGLLYTAQITLYAVTSGVAGFTSATLYRQLRGARWVRNVGLTLAAFAAPFFAVFCVVNTIAIAYRCALWLCCDALLCCAPGVCGSMLRLGTAGPGWCASQCMVLHARVPAAAMGSMQQYAC